MMKASEGGDYIVDLALKPLKQGQSLWSGEKRLLLSYIGEILEEVEIEEKRIIAEERRAAREITARKSNHKKEDQSCK